MTYDEIVAAIHSASMTQIPALIQECVNAGKQKGTFVDGRAAVFVRSCFAMESLDPDCVVIQGLGLRNDGDDIVVDVQVLDGRVIECIREHAPIGEHTISHHLSAYGIMAAKVRDRGKGGNNEQA